MRHTPPDISNGTKKDEVDEVYEGIKRITDPIFNKVLKEADSNQVLGGCEEEKRLDIIYYNPHNYRLYFSFEKATYKTQIPSLPNVRGLGYTHKIKNYGKEHEYDNFFNCRIRVKKIQVEVTNKINPKQWYPLDLAGAKEQIENIIRKKDLECIDVLKKFIKIHGGSSDYKILNRTGDHKIMNESFINRIPEKMTFRTTTKPRVKKVYKEKSIEMYDHSFVTNYLQNAALKEFSPEIVDSMVATNEGISKLTKAVDYFATNINKHVPVYQKIADNTERLTETISLLRHDITMPKEEVLEKQPLTLPEMISVIKKKEDVVKILEPYQELEWEDRFKILEHLKKVM